MQRIQEFIKNLGTEIREAFLKFPITMIVTSLWTIAMVLERVKIIVALDKRLISFFLGILMISSLLIESIFRQNRKRKAIFEILAGIIALFFSFAINTENVLSQQTFKSLKEMYWGGIHRYVIGYCALCILTTILIWYQRSGKKMETYCILVFQQMIRTVAIYLFICLGCAAVIGSFVFLILEGKDFGLLDKMEWCVFGLFFLPSATLNFCDPKNEVDKFTARIVKFVLLPVVLGAILIIYLYIIKMMIPFTIPSNQIFIILAALFTFGMLVWTMIGHFDEDTLFMRLAERMPYLFLPLLLLQGYTLGTRLALYGMTPNRYLGILFMLFEFLYFCIYRLRREHISVMIIVLEIMIVVATWIPGINMVDMSIKNQKAIVEQYFLEDIDEAPDTIWKRIYGAYVWLEKQPECKKYISEKFSQDDLRIIQNRIDNKKIYTGSRIKIYGEHFIEDISVEDVKKVVPVVAYSNSQINADNIVFYRNCNEREIPYEHINLKKVIMEYIKYAQQVSYDQRRIQKYLKENNRVDLGGNKILYIDAIDFSFESDDDLILQLHVKGFILEKE